MAMVEFNGNLYNDDRMFVLYIAPCVFSENRDTITYEVFHETPPPEHTWCIVTYRNTQRYPASKVDIFKSKEEAEKYKANVEPGCPLVSLRGEPKKFGSFEDYINWKNQQDFEEYDYRKMYSSEGTNPSETMIMPK